MLSCGNAVERKSFLPTSFVKLLSALKDTIYSVYELANFTFHAVTLGFQHAVQYAMKKLTVICRKFITRKQFNRQLLISGLARTGRENSDNREFSEDDGSWVGLGSCTIFGTKLVSTDLGEI